MIAACVASIAITGAARASETQEIATSAITGQSAYNSQCASCHGKALQGAFGPPLKGPAFAKKWSDTRKLQAYISAEMPPGNPNSLAPGISRAIAIFLLGKNLAGGSGAPADSAYSTLAEAIDAQPGASSSEGGGILAPIENFDGTYQNVVARRSARLAELGDVSDADLVNPAPGDWLQWRRTYDGHGFSPLTSIKASNVGSLTVAWSLALKSGSNGIIPLAHDGILFVNSSGTVSAIDAKSSDILWTFDRAAEVSAMGPPVTQPRGMALYKTMLLVPTLDNHLIALDMRTGKLVWDRLIDPGSGSLRVSGAPLIVRGNVILGLSGCAGNAEPGGCFIVALNAMTGKEAWRFHTIARPGEANGDSWNGAPIDERFGGSLWTGGTYDSENNLILFGAGQTYRISALMENVVVPGVSNSALYTDATLALSPESGKLVWFYQHMARDVWDMDWGFERQVADLYIRGRKQRVVMTMGKLGILDILDARTGKYLSSYDMGYQTLVTAIDPASGKKTTAASAEPMVGKAISMCPFATGVRNWPSTSFDSATGRLFVPFNRNCMDLIWERGGDFEISYRARVDERADGKFGGMAAIDVSAGHATWSTAQRAPSATSALATAGGIVFDGTRDRSFRALDSKTGRELWSLQLDGVPSATPITFMAEGEQYVAVTTGGGNPNDIGLRSLTPDIANSGPGVRLWLFKLPRSNEAR
jgi:alcohol dehydrogenase (cytochrome c)